MKFKFLGNAGGTFLGSKGTKILCDPWIVDGVFEGSWYHYPPLKTKISDIQNVDAIYVSHVHPDHFDDRNFHFPKDIPLIILDEGPNFLKKNLMKMGYDNFVEIRDNQTKKFKEFNLTIFKPFTKHIYEESLVGNLIDSALVLEDHNTVAVNFNDNTPDEKACQFLKNKFKKIDLALLGYNAAGPYPSCFENLSENERKDEHHRILKRNFEHLCKIIPILEPKSIIPFAGSYVIGGKNYYKNKYLGTTTWDECADFLKKNLKAKINVVTLRENQTFDILNQLQLEKYERLDLDDMKKYIESIKDHKYDYEKDDEPSISKLIEDSELASKKMGERLKRFNAELNTNVFIQIKDKTMHIIKGKDKNSKLICELDNKLLRRILDKKAHWNNAEIGTHITFKRYPNKMEPDTHTLMSFFHL